MWLESGLRGVRSAANSGVFEGYCFAELQVPPQPSERRHVPEPLRPESRPVLVKVTPWPWPNVLTEPPVLTVPRTPSPMTLPELTTTAPLVLPPQPTLTTTQAPSKPRRHLHRHLRFAEATSVSSVAGLLRRAGAPVRPSGLKKYPGASRTATSRRCRSSRRRCRTARRRTTRRGRRSGGRQGRSYGRRHWA